LIPLGPLMHRLPTHAQLPGNGRQPLAAFGQGHGAQTAGFPYPGLTSRRQNLVLRASTLRRKILVSSFLYRDL
jgi:hypothetical protein